MKTHWNDDEIQEFLEGERIGDGRLAHLEGCASCRGRVDLFRRLFTVLDDADVPAPSAAFEAAVMARVFPRRAAGVSRAPVPRWARVLVPALFLAGSAALYSFLRLAGVLGDDVLRWIYESDPGLLGFAARKLTLLAPLLVRGIDGFVGLVSVAGSIGRAAVLVGHTPQARLMILGSAGLLVLFLLGWGTRVLRSRIKGGHHDLLLL